MALWRFLAYSNLFVALCAVSYTAAYYQLWNIPYDTHYLGLIFMGTLGLYSLHRFISFSIIDRDSRTARIDWIRKRSIKMLILAALSSIAALYVLIFRIEKELITLILLGSPAGLLYAIPYNSQGKRVRDWPLIKGLLIGFFWSYYCAFIPLALSTNAISWKAVITLLGSCSFVLALVIPFDIRDHQIDSKRYIQTLSTILGPNRAKRISIILLLFALFTFSLVAFLGNNLSYGFILSITIGLILVKNIKDNAEELYFSIIIESCLMLPFLTNLLLYGNKL